MMDGNQAREELDKVTCLVLTARRLLAGGTLVDLSALEERVRVVCDAVQAMSREEGKILLEPMEQLIGKLDSLAADLQRHLAQTGAGAAPAPSAATAEASTEA